MGRVFRAHDSKLKRDVAIKALPEEFSSDAARIARFQREAEALASLSHSNIAGIHDVLELDGSKFLVLELIEGETLAQRIARSAIPVDEAIEIAKQIAEALEAAHEHGIVHRDLKPANVKIAADGKVKVLDFGLAKMRDPITRPQEGLSNSPTVVSGTVPGVIMGTAAYMSPEQARGKTVDRSADIWAFACVLYEMLTSRKAFDGETVTDIFGAIVRGEPDWNAFPTEVPAHVRRLLRRCLAKDRKRRLRDAGSVLLELNEGSGDAVVVPVRKGEWLSWAIAGVLGIAFIGALVLALRPNPKPPELLVELTTPAGSDPGSSFAISPDAQKLVFLGAAENQARLWLRTFDSTIAKPLPGTENANNPFWSPDSRSIGFFADGKLKRIDVGGGSSQTLSNAPNNRGGTWGPNNIILFAPVASGAIFRVSDTGGEPTAVTHTELGRQAGHRFPQFLPDGQHFLFYVQGTPEARGVYVASLDGTVSLRLLDADSAATYAFGYLLFIRQSTLFAQKLEPQRLAVSGSPFAVAEQVTSDGSNKAAVSASFGNTLVYRTIGPADQRQFVWFDRSGKELERIGTPDSASVNSPNRSPDGRRLAIIHTINGNNDIWLLEIQRGILARLVSSPAQEAGPVWSPDGRRLAFTSNRKGIFDLYEKPATGAGDDQSLLATQIAKYPTDWSPDGAFLIYRQADPKTDWDIWVLPMNGDRKPFPVVQTNFAELDAQFSPDGKWIAYQSNESDRFEIYVQAFPGPATKLQVSTNGGIQVRWRRDGKELFYVSPDGQLMAVPIELSSKTATVEAGVPKPLFRPRMIRAGATVSAPQYSVSPDGQRLLVNTIVGEANASPLTVVLNWNPSAAK